MLPVSCARPDVPPSRRRSLRLLPALRAQEVLIRSRHVVACVQQLGLVLIYRVWEPYRAHRIQRGMHASSTSARHAWLVQILTVRLVHPVDCRGRSREVVPMAICSLGDLARPSLGVL